MTAFVGTFASALFNRSSARERLLPTELVTIDLNLPAHHPQNV
jgi:hypothetical protein